MARTIHRRPLLLGLASALSVSAVGRRLLSDQTQAAPVKRLVLLMQNNGTQQSRFWPAGSAFTSPILEPLVRDPAIAKRTMAVKGIFIPRDANGTSANEHDMGFARMFTGAKLLNVGGQPWGGAASVDQIVARHWQVKSLNLAILASSVEPKPKPGFDHRRSFCYLGPGQHKLPIVNPYDAYVSLFSDFPKIDDPVARTKLSLRMAALGAVHDQLQTVRDKLGQAEQAKLDLNLSSVRDLETRLQAMRDGQSPPGAKCSLRPAQSKDYSQTPSLLLNDESAIPEMATTMLDLIAASLACNVTRVATMQFGYGGGKWRYAWEGLNRDFHGRVAHSDTSDAGSSPTNTDRVVAVNRYYASQVAYLAAKLNAVPEGEGTMLDHTLIVWANEFGRGDHSLNNVPIVFVGGPASGMTTGGRVVDAGAQTFQRVGCTILNAMGVPSAGFGDEPQCGPLRGV
ncbi:DUF1552 domain-containing protein [Pendulispora brunnea]|uniref:DUF1552 domain-containing protein n=1 Tax=Pendulispora brunnea TaxID=2905690 RepID=A0ABZ2K0S5_9BACT